MTRSGVREHEARNAKMRENTSSSWIKTPPSPEDDDKMKQFKKLIWAFGQENQDSEFDWDRWYGEGSDVVNFAPENKI